MSKWLTVNSTTIPSGVTMSISSTDENYGGMSKSLSTYYTRVSLWSNNDIDSSYAAALGFQIPNIVYEYGTPLRADESQIDLYLLVSSASSSAATTITENNSNLDSYSFSGLINLGFNDVANTATIFSVALILGRAVSDVTDLPALIRVAVDTNGG